jgi:FAD/FMN-containing dehydrogenase
MSISPAEAPDLEALGAAIRGDVTAPGDPGYDAARQAWNLIADQHPAFVVQAESTDDVAAVVRFAREHGLRVAPQATGHGAASMGDLGGTILLRTSRMTAVSIDPGTRIAHVQSGTPWNAVVPAAAEHGLAALHGFSGTVGVAGYTLAGGLGWLARWKGLASNHVVALEVVTADGDVLRVDADHEPDLFWALRGGGGDHAIVTALELELVELTTVYAGALLWPIEQASAVAHAWLQWTRTVPETLTSDIKLVRLPPLPQIPEPLRGRSLVTIGLAFAGDAAQGEALVAPLRAVAEPYLDMVGELPAAALAAIAGDPVDPGPARGDGILLSDLDAAGIDAFVDVAGPDADTSLLQLELRHLGGALDVSSPDHGALDTVDAGFVLYGVGMAMSPQMDAAVEASLAHALERMAPWSADRTLLSFAEGQPGMRRSFPPAVADRLVALKRRYDPENRIVANHVSD